MLATPFDEAGAPLFSEPPGCLFLNQGSFMPAFFADAGAEPGTDFDFFPFPELSASRPTASTVIGAGDLFGLLTESPAAAELMRRHWDRSRAIRLIGLRAARLHASGQETDLLVQLRFPEL